jgi:hypothetical protein
MNVTVCFSTEVVYNPKALLQVEDPYVRLNRSAFGWIYLYTFNS